MATDIYADATVLVTVQCEVCQRPYEYEQEVSVWGDAWAEEKSLLKVCAERLAASIEQKSVEYLRFNKCPKCSHVQSWMNRAYREHLQAHLNELVWGGGPFVGLAAVAVFALVALSVGLAVASVFVLVVIAWLALFLRRRLALIGNLRKPTPKDALSSGPIEVRVIREPQIEERYTG